MRIKIELSEESFKRAAAEVRAYAESLDDKCAELSRRLAEIGVDAAVSHVRRESGSLASSIRSERSGERAYLVLADSEYAVYVEFGTGVVGSKTPYAGQLPDWATGPGSRSTKTREDGSWIYYDQVTGEFKSTFGQAPSAFMAAGAEAVRKAVVDTAKEVFKS